jgi:DNA-directed RNA polymerase subunit RPC12/RpoP
VEDIEVDCANCGKEITVPKILVDESPGGVLCEGCSSDYLRGELVDAGDFEE